MQSLIRFLPTAGKQRPLRRRKLRPSQVFIAFSDLSFEFAERDHLGVNFLHAEFEA
jgi:hypothetical protein